MWKVSFWTQSKYKDKQKLMSSVSWNYTSRRKSSEENHKANKNNKSNLKKTLGDYEEICSLQQENQFS